MSLANLGVCCGINNNCLCDRCCTVRGVKLSQGAEAQTIPTAALIPYTAANKNFNISFANLVNAIAVAINIQANTPTQKEINSTTTQDPDVDIYIVTGGTFDLNLVDKDAFEGPVKVSIPSTVTATVTIIGDGDLIDGNPNKVLTSGQAADFIAFSGGITTIS